MILCCSGDCPSRGWAAVARLGLCQLIHLSGGEAAIVESMAGLPVGDGVLGDRPGKRWLTGLDGGRPPGHRFIGDFGLPRSFGGGTNADNDLEAGREPVMVLDSLAPGR